MMPNSGNKGEWSEFYVLLKLVTEKKIYGADEDLQKIDSLIYPILKVMLSRSTEDEVSYELNENDDCLKISDVTGTDYPIVRSEEIRPKVREVFEAIKNSTTTTFQIPATDDLIPKLKCRRLQGRNIDKTDITLVIHDHRTQTTPEIGFSIKSQIGGASTLLNASGATNFIYKINGDQAVANWAEVNQIPSLGGKLARIKELGGSLEFLKTNNRVFERNLRAIDTVMPEIVSEMLKVYFMENISSVENIAEKLIETDPLSNFSPRYDLKIKKLLKDTALGMMPSREWDGRMEANGGYIVVREDGEVVCYNVYYSDSFEDFLYKNTKLETASRGRHGFGVLYEEDGLIKINLNLQIRFKR